MHIACRNRGDLHLIRINLVAVGKVKEKYFLEGINEYAKRLSRYCEFNIVEVKEENFEKVDQSLINNIKQKEAERILPNLKGGVYCMAIEGKKFDSLSFAKEISKASQSNQTLTFVIGGSYGIADSIKQKADKLISFSDMTFPHTMFRLMLTEQLYRAFSILNGIGYHK